MIYDRLHSDITLTICYCFANQVKTYLDPPSECFPLSRPAPDLKPELLPLGQDTVIVRFSTSTAANVGDAVRGFLAEVEQSGLCGITEVAGSLGSVLVRFDPQVVSRHTMLEGLTESLARRGWCTPAAVAPKRRWIVPAAFGGDFGPQLREAADMAGLSEAQAVTELTGAGLKVLAIGFAPGQPYLGPLPQAWDIPRQPALTPRVPAGAIAVAVRQLVLFANPGPTGWRQVGRSGFRPFLQDRAEPFLLRQGDLMRFERVADSDLRSLLDSPDGLGGARCEALA